MSGRLRGTIQRAWTSVLDLFYPPYCEVCGATLAHYEEHICNSCRSRLTLTEHATMRQNALEMQFADIDKFVRGGAYCYYSADSVIRQLIHLLKYGNRAVLGPWLGREAALYFMSANADFFSDIDIIMPIPLHPNKLRQRGYNQAELIAEGIAEVTGLPIDTTSLRRVKDNTTQTTLTTAERLRNAHDIFSLGADASYLTGRHILLVDDVVTSGATMRDSIRCLTPLRGTRVSVMALGLSTYNAAEENTKTGVL